MTKEENNCLRGKRQVVFHKPSLSQSLNSLLKLKTLRELHHIMIDFR